MSAPCRASSSATDPHHLNTQLGAGRISLMKGMSLTLSVTRSSLASTVCKRGSCMRDSRLNDEAQSAQAQHHDSRAMQVTLVLRVLRSRAERSRLWPWCTSSPGHGCEVGASWTAFDTDTRHHTDMCSCCCLLHHVSLMDVLIADSLCILRRAFAQNGQILAHQSQHQRRQYDQHKSGISKRKRGAVSVYLA
jgi:hypothetical protein